MSKVIDLDGHRLNFHKLLGARFTVRGPDWLPKWRWLRNLYDKHIGKEGIVLLATKGEYSGKIFLSGIVYNNDGSETVVAFQENNPRYDFVTQGIFDKNM